MTADSTPEDLDNLEPYCKRCGATIGIFQGHGPDWRHFTGRGTAENPNTVYFTSHMPVVAWREPADPQ